MWLFSERYNTSFIIRYFALALVIERLLELGPKPRLPIGLYLRNPPAGAGPAGVILSPKVEFGFSRRQRLTHREYQRHGRLWSRSVNNPSWPSSCRWDVFEAAERRFYGA